MNRSTINFIAFLAIAVFLSTIAFFSFKMISYAQQGRDKVIVQCTDLTQQSIDLMDYFDGVNEAFYKNYTSVLDNVSNIAAVILEDESRVFYTYPSQTSLLAKDETNKITIKTQSPLISVFSTRLVHDTRPLKLTFALYHISPHSIHDLAKKSFFIIFITTAFILLFIIINSILRKDNKDSIENYESTNYKPEYYESKIFDSEIYEPEKYRSLSNFKNPIQYESDFNLDKNLDLNLSNNDYQLKDDDFNFNDLDLDSLDFELDKTATDLKTDLENDIKKDFRNDISNDITKDISNDIVKKPENLENLEVPQIKIQHHGKIISDPLGLFSPRTGFGWESYLETRLDAELARASSSEQDLALILVKIRGIEHYPAYFEYVSEVLLSIFKFRDLIFEYGKDSFACLYQDLNVEKTLELSEELYVRLKEIFKNCDVKIAIGISTRALRIIPGTRILQEADQAIEKAMVEKENPIIAFKANPDKYKNYVWDNA